MSSNQTIEDIEQILRRHDGEVEDVARAIYSSVVPKIADRITPEIERRVRRQMVDDGWREPANYDHLTRTALLEVAIGNITKKLIEFPSTPYTEDQVRSLSGAMAALEISKRIDREQKEAND